MTLRAVLPTKELAISAALLLAFLAFARQGIGADGQSFPEYRKYVHTYVNSSGLADWTFVEKPVFPALTNSALLFNLIHQFLFGGQLNSNNADIEK